MKTLRFIFRISVTLSLGMFLLALTACRPEEEEWRRRSRVVEGEEATISLKWAMPDMKEREFQLFAAVSEERARTVQDLWVGIYNVKTGECTTNALLDLNNTDAEHTVQTLPALKTKSGNSYIVAVANPKTNYGFSTRIGEKGDTTRLVDLLQQAETWADYKAITVVLPKVDEVHPVGRFLVMSGSYHDDPNIKNEPSINVSGNPTPMTIEPGPNQFTGYIHLRRLFSYNRFTVKPGQYVSMELQSWQVVNLPVMSYLQERLEENAADVSEYFADATGATAAYKGNYTSSAASHVFEAGAKDDEYIFDFYQFENRHTGLKKDGDVGVATYNDRDREFKTATGTNTVSNTGVYKSLCNNAATPKPGPDGVGVNTNNFATYVIINATVSYYTASAGLNETAIDPNELASYPNAVLRTGRVFYVVHLGYCEEKEGVIKERDFNVRRNHWYDYTVTIKGLSNIAVEARDKDVENQPGAEGNVYDSRYVVELDAHNAVFNIKLTNQQRTDLQWIIQAPYGNEPDRELTYADYPFDQPEPTALRTNEFYNWIRFKPAPDSLLLAIYKELGETDADLWTLEDLRHVATHPGIDKNGIEEMNPDVDDASTGRWYTVFVNEYVYETDPTNETTGRWKMYANKPDRIAYLNTKEVISNDGNSRYMQPQYTIIQKSIQTYYNILSDETTSALGAERENENYGLNMRWSKSVSSTNLNTTYGWHNTVAYAQGRAWYGADGIFAEGVQVGPHYYLHAATVPAIVRPEQDENQPAKTYPIYRMNTVSGGYTATEDDPSATNAFYEIMAACMNRNRDENGNNVVDKEEIKWYLATTDEYLRIVLGRESLKKPLMPFGVGIAKDPGAGNASRHHYAASDYQMVWAEEGVSTSPMAKNTDVGAGSNGLYAWPWQVRCLRAMGVDFSINEEVTPAYWADRSNHLIHFNYYDEASLRPAQSGTMSVHSVGDLKNRASRQLEYAVANCINMSVQHTTGAFGTNSNGTLRCYATTTRDDDTWTYWREQERDATKAHVEDYWTASVNTNEICAQYTQYTGGIDKGTWRVPNQVEVTVMLRLGILSGSGNWLSCTKEYYPMDKPTRFISVSSDGVTLGGNKPFRVRCVRDVE